MLQDGAPGRSGTGGGARPGGVRSGDVSLLLLSPAGRSWLPLIVEAPRPAHCIAPCRAAHALPVLTVVVNFAGRPHGGPVAGIALPLEARKVLGPDAFVVRVGCALALRNLDESPLGRRSGWSATGGKIFELPSVHFKRLDLFFREDLSGAADGEANRRHWYPRLIGIGGASIGIRTIQANDTKIGCEDVVLP